MDFFPRPQSLLINFKMFKICGTEPGTFKGPVSFINNLQNKLFIIIYIYLFILFIFVNYL